MACKASCGYFYSTTIYQRFGMQISFWGEVSRPLDRIRSWCRNCRIFQHEKYIRPNGAGQFGAYGGKGIYRGYFAREY